MEKVMDDMTEIEAVKQLERHIEYLRQNWKPHPDYDVLEAIRIAISALEKQIPKNTTTNIDDVFIQKKCSVCGNIIMPFDSKYCCDCGQRLE